MTVLHIDVGDDDDGGDDADDDDLYDFVMSPVSDSRAYMDGETCRVRRVHFIFLSVQGRVFIAQHCARSH